MRTERRGRGAPRPPSVRIARGRPEPGGMGMLGFSLVMLGAVILVGTLGFWAVEEDTPTLLDSFYFTLVTVATVGYGDIAPRTAAGKALAAGIIVMGVGVVLVTVQAGIESLVGKRIKKELNLPDKATTKERHRIVCGFGMVGQAVVRHLQRRGFDYIVIEWDEGKVERMVEAKIPVIKGDAREEGVMRRAGIDTATCLISTLDDASNVFVTLTAKLLNPGVRVVSKTEGESNALKLKRAGADAVIACHDVGAAAMVDATGREEER